MKKTIRILSVLLALLILVGCESGESPKTGAAPKNSVSSVLEQQMNLSANAAAGTENASAKSGGSAVGDYSGSIDLDLTALSSTMVYSEVYSMMAEPETFVGQTVKMKGQFSVYQATDAAGQPIPDQIYFACVIADATACCSQGLEFILDGAEYPDDYPAPGEEITVVGRFQTYMEGNWQYCHLVNAELVA